MPRARDRRSRCYLSGRKQPLRDEKALGGLEDMTDFGSKLDQDADGGEICIFAGRVEGGAIN